MRVLWDSNLRSAAGRVRRKADSGELHKRSLGRQLGTGQKACPGDERRETSLKGAR